MENNLLNELDKVRFLPWIGKDYQNGGIFGKRILVLGESHYCGSCTREMCEHNFDDCRDFTVSVVSDSYLNKQREYANWMKTFTCFERSLVGEWTDEESRIKIWDSVAFYNYLQYALDTPGKAGESDAYQKAIEPFYQVLDYCKPELIIVWGKRLWGWLPGDTRWEECESMKFGSLVVDNGYYKLSNGNKAKVFPVYHPSRGYAWEFWHEVIKNMIETL